MKNNTTLLRYISWQTLLLLISRLGGLFLIFAVYSKLSTDTAGAFEWFIYGVESVVALLLLVRPLLFWWTGMSLYLAFVGYHIMLLYYGVPNCSCLGKSSVLSSAQLFSLDLFFVLVYFLTGLLVSHFPRGKFAIYAMLSGGISLVAGLIYGQKVGSLLP